MSRIPAGLLYLTIYNPTFHPVTETPSEDDEDAEEQSHILFYTARERAVSRDRMLRQVGLAKALINFSEMFNADEQCENVHSQTRRMIMVSPEPNYWIHACFEVAKTPRSTQMKTKNKEKAKVKGKGKNKENVLPQEVTYDYHDGSIHDLALRAHILCGYEQFKLTHGSFDSILSSIGQQALELQLERFFTMWAWKWDIEEDTDFGSFLGVPVHLFHRNLTPLIDGIASKLPQDTPAFVLMPPYVIPSSKFTASGFPSSLTRHILSRIPPSPPVAATSISPSSKSNPVPVPDDNGGTSDDAGQQTAQGKKPQDGIPGSPAGTFLAMPNVNLDVRQFKWNWPGYLTFGKQSSAKPSAVSVALPDASQTAVGEADQQGKPDQATEGDEKTLSVGAVEVDKESLQEAMSSHGIPTSSSLNTSPASSSKLLDNPQEIQGATGTNDDTPEVDSTIPDIPVVEDGIEISSPNTTDDAVPSPLSIPSLAPDREIAEDVPPKPLPTFLPTTVHLAHTMNGTDTHKRRVWHITSNSLTFALVTEYEYDASVELLPMAQQIIDVLSDMQRIIAEEQKKAETYNAMPTATKILQPEDEHIISTGDYTKSSSSGFTSKSEHLFNGQQLLQSGLEVTEVFSRGLNPQHWHIAKRGLGVDRDNNDIEGAVYMEVARKESSLNDVDNELAGIVRKFVQ
ncbi:hypothetical protein B0H21DRAFT_780155 [Amylocystis lapponica]|nr:hypothetical protein B0H21DRAFT_780155 [Amylocystis lapponica]